MSVAFFGGEGGTRIKLLLRKILLIYSALARLTINPLFQNPPVASFTLVNLSGGKTIHRIVFYRLRLFQGFSPSLYKKTPPDFVRRCFLAEKEGLEPSRQF